MTEGATIEVEDAAEMIPSAHLCGNCLYTMHNTGEIDVVDNCTGNCNCPPTPDPSTMTAGETVVLSCVSA